VKQVTATGKTTRRYLVVPAGSYPAPTPPLYAAPSPAPAFRSAPEPSLPLEALDAPDFGLRDIASPAPSFENAGSSPTPTDFATAQTPPGPLVSTPPPARLAAPRLVRALWARGLTRRMLFGAALGGFGGAVIGMVMLWMSQPGGFLVPLLNPVLLWRGADQYHKFTLALVAIGFAVLGAAVVTWFAGESDARPD
jgi:hypothetical protein